LKYSVSRNTFRKYLAEKSGKTGQSRAIISGRKKAKMLFRGGIGNDIMDEKEQ